MNLLTDEIIFPDYTETNSYGIIAVGGDLSLERLKLAYRKGIFPWFNPNEPIIWWFPNPRFVLFPNELKVPKSARKVLNSGQFQFTENQAFEAVITHCQQIKRNHQDGTWITDEMVEAYLQLHQAGWAKSVEVWEAGELVGGFYGVDIGHIFCGESMFSKVSNASKSAFIYFVEKYAQNYQLIDCQIHSQHLANLGAREIDANEFVRYLEKV